MNKKIDGAPLGGAIISLIETWDMFYWVVLAVPVVLGRLLLEWRSMDVVYLDNGVTLALYSMANIWLCRHLPPLMSGACPDGRR